MILPSELVIITIEMFVYHTSLTGQQTYFGDTYGGGSGADGIYTYKTTNNEISLYDSAQRSLSAQNVIKAIPGTMIAFDKGKWNFESIP